MYKKINFKKKKQQQTNKKVLAELQIYSDSLTLIVCAHLCDEIEKGQL